MNFVYVNIDWYVSTFIFYLCVIIGCYIVAAKNQNKVIVLLKKRVYLWSIIISVILLFVKGMGTTGRDLRGGYYNNFRQATSLSNFPDYTVEVGYRLLNVIVRNITEQYPVFIFIIACLSLHPVISLLKKYKDDIDLPIAVLMYVSIFFFNGFSAIRICLAASIALYAFDAMVEQNATKALFWIVFASFFHTTALLLFIPYFFSMIQGLNKKMVGISLIFFFLVGYIGRNSINSIMVRSERYSVYSSFDNVNIGMEQILYFAPLFAIYFMGRKNDTNKQFSVVAFAYLGTAFCFGMLGYVVSIIGRLRDMFVPLIFIESYYVKRLKAIHNNYRILINLLVLIYCLARFYIYISQYYNMEDLMPYTNIFGWII